MQHPQKQFMELAIQKAVEGGHNGAYALAAVVVDPQGNVVSSTHNTAHADNDPTAHGEVNAIREACRKAGSRYLPGCWLYSTLEPCPMCAAAAVWAKMEGVVFGAAMEDAEEFAQGLQDKKFTWRQIGIHTKEVFDRSTPQVQLVEGFMREECQKLFEFAKNG